MVVMGREKSLGKLRNSRSRVFIGVWRAKKRCCVIFTETAVKQSPTERWPTSARIFLWFIFYSRLRRTLSACPWNRCQFALSIKNRSGAQWCWSRENKTKGKKSIMPRGQTICLDIFLNVLSFLSPTKNGEQRRTRFGGNMSPGPPTISPP